MKHQGIKLFSVGVVLLLGATSLYVGTRLPVGAQVPVHWDAAGRINGYAGKWLGLSIAPLMAMITSLVFAGVMIAEPKQDNLAKSRGLFATAWAGVLAIAVIVELVQIGTLLDWDVPVGRLIVGGIGLFFVALGNQLAKSRPMYLVGIRTPWTLADPDVWIATHRLGGKLMMGAGLVWLVAGACGWVGPSWLPLLVAVLIVAAVWPVVYSYRLWRKAGRQQGV